jgi:hypothetical protein
MSIATVTRNPWVLATALVLGAATVASAQQEQRVLRWSGQVDRGVDITIRGGQAYTSGQDSRDRRGSIRVENGLPREDGQLSVRVLEGRGNATVIQQPSSSNGYTAVIRVQDPQPGVGQYRLETYFSSYNNGQLDDRRGRGNGRGNGRDRGYGNGGYGNGSGNGNGGLKGQIGDGVNGGYNGNLHGSVSWSGLVDDQAEITIRGSRADTRTISGNAVQNVRVGSLRSGLPNANVQVSVSQAQGRGQAWVVQQPTAQNGYTAVIRVRDPQAGASYYNLNVSW